MDTLILIGVVAALGTLAVGSLLGWPTARTVFEHERALRYRRGRLVGVVEPGRYWLWSAIDRLQVIDARKRQVLVSGQEVLTSDRVPIKISLVAEMTVQDVKKALTSVERYQETIYTRIQMALREAVATRTLDEALEDRGTLASTIAEAVTPTAEEVGVELHRVDVRDYMMAAGLRSAYADVVEAKQRGLATLERARGESAAIRNLANSAEMMERHPGLMQLRLLQAIESGSGNRIVVTLGSDGANAAATETVVEAEG